jgi:hypothetical protein
MNTDSANAKELGAVLRDRATKAGSEYKPVRLRESAYWDHLARGSVWGVTGTDYALARDAMFGGDSDTVVWVKLHWVVDSDGETDGAWFVRGGTYPWDRWTYWAKRKGRVRRVAFHWGGVVT